MVDFSSLVTETKVPAVYAAPEKYSVPGVKAVFIEGVPYKGKPTRFFAYYALPEGATAESKVPAIVLVHGGLAAALSGWVKLWTSRGYAAISMDTCAHVPTENGGQWPKCPANSSTWDTHEWSGPEGWGGFDHIDDEITDQWPFHAVSTVIRSRQFIASLPEVDASRIGLTGVSWGGYLTCIAGSVDSNFKFAAPVYGCGFLGDHSRWLEQHQLDGENGRKWLSLWDPSVYLPEAKIPFLWLDSTNDVHYPLDIVRKSASLVKSGNTFAIIKDLVHAHGDPSEKPLEILAFADAILRGGKKPVSIGKVSTAGGVFEAPFDANGRKVVRADFIWTSDPNPAWGERKWQSRAIEGFNPADGKFQTYYPSDARVYYVNLVTDDGLVSSSDWVIPLAGSIEEKLQSAINDTKPLEYENAAGQKLHYRWHEPAHIVPGEKYPLVIFMHGAGERGAENIRQMIHGVPQMLNYAQRKNLSFFLLAGQVPGGECSTDPQGHKWVQVPWDGNTQPMPETPSDSMAALIDLIGELRMNPAVDASRIYVTGLSMGGYGTWDLIMRKPDWFAAAMPVCGGADDSKVAIVKDMAIWVFHGGNDSVVNPERARNAVAALRAVGGNVKHTEYPGVNHDSWSPTYSDDKVLDWMFAQKRG